MSRILLLLDQAVNRRLLAECLRATSYAAATGTDEDLEQRFDLCIMDATALDRLERRVLERKQAEAPVFLPVLLVVSRQDVGMITRHLWRTVDELVTAPVEKAELLARTAVLLRARQYSLELEASRRELARVFAVLAERYQSLFERSSDLVAIVDADGSIKYLNASWREKLGWVPGEALGSACEAIVAPEDREAFRHAMFKAAETGTAENMRVRLVPRQGQPMTVEGSVSATALAGELLCVFHDVTERERLEEQLRQAQKMEAVGRLAGGVAHDFNNLLTVITGHCQLALAQLPQEHPARDSIEEIAAAADKAAGITGQLLAFSKRQVVQPGPISISKSVARLEKMLRHLIGEDVKLEVALDAGVGLVRADAGQLDQVLMNLAVNARDAMPEGGTLRIAACNLEVREQLDGWPDSVPAGRYVLLEVRDTGTGMDAETVRRVFEPFFTTKPWGTGLGLSTVREMVAGWGGRIQLETAPGRGARFAIYVPLHPGAPPAGEPTGQTRPVAGAETILLAEDNAALRALMRAVLQRYGYRVLESHGTGEALRLAQTYPGPMHLLLTDVIMPEMSGVRLAERVRAIRPEIKVLYTTGYTAALPARELPVTELDCLPKPFTPDELLSKVRAVLDQRE